jgi:hypothetical protein
MARTTSARNGSALQPAFTHNAPGKTEDDSLNPRIGRSSRAD